MPEELQEIKEKLVAIESLLQRLPEIQSAVFLQMLDEYQSARLTGKKAKAAQTAEMLEAPVSYKQQTLAEDQQAQARENIGALSKMDYYDLIPVDAEIKAGYVDNSGVIQEQTPSSANRYVQVDVAEGEIYHYAGKQEGWLKNVWLYNGEDVLDSIDSDLSYNAVVEHDFTIPKSCTSIIAQFSANGQLFKYVPYEKSAETPVYRYEDITAELAVCGAENRYVSFNGITAGSEYNYIALTPSVNTIYRLTVKQKVYPIAVLDQLIMLNNNEGYAIDDVTIFDRELEVKVPANHTLYVNVMPDYPYTIEELKPVEDLSSIKIVKTVYQAGNAQPVGTIFIAAANATEVEKANATYICTGEHDETVINAAIQTIPETGGKIQLSSGVFSLSSPILIDRRVSLYGQGASVGSRAAYETTNGNTFDNTFGSAQFGATTIRIDADCDGMQVTQFVRGLTLKDFFLQGYGKDRHTKAGINILQSTDVLLIDGINISDCCVCIYAINSQDAPCIVNSGFEWCGCGIIMHAWVGKFGNLIFCDNNGLDAYEGNEIHCGGFYARISSSTITGCQIMRSNKYEGGTQAPTHLLCLNGGQNAITGNVLLDSSGCGIYGINANSNVISGNTINNVGSRGVDDNNDGIYFDASSEGNTIVGNNIGLTYGTDEIKAKYPMRKAVNIRCAYGTGDVIVGNRSAYATDTEPFYSAHSKSVIANNLIGT